MARVVGVGGVMFKSADPSAVAGWYRRVLGVEMGPWGAFFPASGPASLPGAGTAYSAQPSSADTFAQGVGDFVINLLVDDLDTLLEQAARAGVQPLSRSEAPYGRFARLCDPEGRVIELWQPVAQAEPGGAG